MKFDPQAAKTAAGISLVTVLIVIGAVFLASSIEDGQVSGCAKRWEGSGYPARFEKGVGCKIQVNGRWILERYFKPERD